MAFYTSIVYLTREPDQAEEPVELNRASKLISATGAVASSIGGPLPSTMKGPRADHRCRRVKFSQLKHAFGGSPSLNTVLEIVPNVCIKQSNTIYGGVWGIWRHARNAIHGSNELSCAIGLGWS